MTSTLGEKMARLETDITYIKAQLTENKIDHEKLILMINNFICAADKKYATQERLSRIEKVVYGAVGAICLAFLAALLTIVIPTL